MTSQTIQIILSAVDKTGNAFKTAEDKFKNIEKNIGSLGKTLSSAGAKMFALGAAIGGGMVVAFNEIDKGMDTVAIATGATGKSLIGLQKVVENIARVTPANFETIGRAVGEVNTRLGLTGKQNEEVSRKFINLARLLGLDVVEVIRNVSRSMLDAGISTDQASLYLDKLLVISQKTGANILDLTEKMTTYGVQFRAIGLSAEEAMMYLAKWEKEGVSVEKMLSGLSIAIGRLAMAGKDPKKAFWELTEQIKKAKTVGEEMRIAIDVLRAKAGPDFALAVSEGRFEIDEYKKALEGAGGSIEKTVRDTEDFSEKILILKNNLLIALRPVLDRMANLIETKFIPIVSKVITKLTEWIDKHPFLSKLILGITILLVGLGGTLLVLGGILSGVSVVFGILGGAIGALSSPILLIVGLLAIIGVAIWVIVKNWRNAWGTIKDLFYAYLVGPLQLAWRRVGLILKNIEDAFVSVWNKIRSATFSIWQSIVGGIKSIINDMIRVVNKMIGGLNKLKIKIPDWAPGGAKTLGFNISYIPYLQEGGIVTKPTFAMVGEAGPEAIIPLKRSIPSVIINVDIRENTFIDIDEVADKIDKILADKLRKNIRLAY